MKIALTNLALPANVPWEAWQMLATEGLNGVEVALTRLASWTEINEDIVISYKQRLEAYGLQVPSLQAILYGVAEAQLLQDTGRFDILEHHLRRVSKFGRLLGAKVAVFGAPKQRIKGTLAAEMAFDIGATRLKRLADVMFNENGITIALEAAPREYGGDFLTTVADVSAMVAEVAHPGLRINLDTGCAHLESEDFAGAVRSNGELIAHVQIAEPKLANFENPVIDHIGAAKALNQQGYQGWVSIEMIEAGQTPLADARQALSFVRRHYLGHAPHPET